MKISLLFASGLMVCAAGAAAQAAGYVAGLHPDRRPDGAPPQPAQAERTPQQMERALHGIEQPAPANVAAVAATGNWWVPLRYPGMNGPYDLRGWHDGDAPAAGAAAAASR